jgi:uncharacterized protein (DUF169 family)
MTASKNDLSIFKKFVFERPPVGVKYFYNKPLNIEQLDVCLPVCEMIKEAQDRGKPFYITKDNENCAGRSALGMLDEPAPSSSGSGEIGVKFGIFAEASANRKIYQAQPRMPAGIKYVVFASLLDSLPFNPDLLFILAKINQAEIILRAMSYTTGETYLSYMTGVGACSWLFVYPYTSGKVNYVVTGLGFGMKARRVYPEGLILLSIPFNWLPVVIQNLKDMEWVLPSFEDGKEKFLERDKRIKEELIRESQNT